jgi:hypothetical protein
VLGTAQPFRLLGVKLIAMAPFGQVSRRFEDS